MATKNGEGKEEKKKEFVWQEVPTAELLKIKPKRNWLKILGLGFLAVAVLCIATLFFSMQNTHSEDIPVVLDALMSAMEAKDFEAAYDLFSDRAQQQFPLAQLEELGSGNNYALFDGYESLQITFSQVGRTVNINPSAPQGVYANVSGTILFGNNFVGTLSASLELVADEWRIWSFNVNVAPEKLEDYLSK